MNKLIKIMAQDMRIPAYVGEPEESYCYRVIYSALGLWCLTVSLSEKDGIQGISKNATTKLLHGLVEKYLQIYPFAKQFLANARNADIALHIRNIYEQMGYLLTLDNNHNVLNQVPKTVWVSENDSIFLGLPNGAYCINGLGIHVENCEKESEEINLKEYIARDNLSPEEYVLSCFNECDFERKEFDLNELEFFNPFYKKKLSEAWSMYSNADIMTIARKSPSGPFYRVMKNEDGQILYADEINNEDILSRTGAEYRRIYVALRDYYLNPMIALVCRIDEEYAYIRILGQLPNREYFYLLLNAWPMNSFNDRNNFIIRHGLTAQVKKILNDIGFSIREGEFYGK